MGTDTSGPGGTAPGASAGPPDGSGDRLISLPGRSPVLDAAQLGVLRGYGSERDVAAGDVLFADGDETYDLFVLLAGTADIIEDYGHPGASVVASFGPSEFLGEIGMLTGPAGLSGEELAARATLQAQKFGVRIKLAAKAASLSSRDGVHQVTFDDGEAIAARSVIIATGARYNRLALDRLAEFEGVGVYYAATQAEAQACGTGPVAVVGGGNSAGQAALFLSRSCTVVHVIIRRDALEASMSRYLIDRIERNPGIIVWPSTQVTALTGANQLEAVRLRGEGQLEASELAVTGLFVFIGAKPGTGWLAGQLAQDKHGFLLTGSDIPAARLEDENLTPLFLETSRPGIFAVGDVRSGSVKRVAAAIGEGSVAVRLAFERLQPEGEADPAGPAAG